MFMFSSFYFIIVKKNVSSYLAVAAFLLLSCQTVSAPSTCPAGWVWISGTCFIKKADPLPWAAAESECVMMSSHLATMTSLYASDLLSVLCLNNTKQSAERACWTGLNDIDKEGDFHWSDPNRDADDHSWLLNWAVHSPDNYEPNNLPRSEREGCANNDSENCGANCVWLYGSDGTIRDWPCDDPMPFICERKANVSYGSQLWRIAVSNSSSVVEISDVELFEDPLCSTKPIDLKNVKMVTSLELAQKNYRSEDDQEEGGITAIITSSSHPELYDGDVNTKLKLQCSNTSNDDTATTVNATTTTTVLPPRALSTCNPEIRWLFNSTIEIQCAIVTRPPLLDQDENITTINLERLESSPPHWFGVNGQFNPGDTARIVFPRAERYSQYHEVVGQQFDLPVQVQKESAGHFVESSRIRIVRRPLNLLHRSCSDVDSELYSTGLGIDVPPSNDPLLTGTKDDAPFFLLWKNVTVDAPGTYEVCHCWTSCDFARQWNDIGDIVISGVAEQEVALVESNILFEFVLPGWALMPSKTTLDSIDSRLKIIDYGASCNTAQLSTKVQGLDCAEPTNCSTPPHTALVSGQLWKGLRIATPEPLNFTACHCLSKCNDEDSWRSITTLSVGVRDSSCSFPIGCLDIYPQCYRYPFPDDEKNMTCVPEEDRFSLAEQSKSDSISTTTSPQMSSAYERLVIGTPRKKPSSSNFKDTSDELLSQESEQATKGLIQSLLGDDVSTFKENMITTTNKQQSKKKLRKSSSNRVSAWAVVLILVAVFIAVVAVFYWLYRINGKSIFFSSATRAPKSQRVALAGATADCY